jgi:hypothetical protein
MYDRIDVHVKQWAGVYIVMQLVASIRVGNKAQQLQLLVCKAQLSRKQRLKQGLPQQQGGASCNTYICECIITEHACYQGVATPLVCDDLLLCMQACSLHHVRLSTPGTPLILHITFDTLA